MTDINEAVFTALSSAFGTTYRGGDTTFGSARSPVSCADLRTPRGGVTGDDGEIIQAVKTLIEQGRIVCRSNPGTGTFVGYIPRKG